jgi:hypothetical protein
LKETTVFAAGVAIWDKDFGEDNGMCNFLAVHFWTANPSFHSSFTCFSLETVSLLRNEFAFARSTTLLTKHFSFWFFCDARSDDDRLRDGLITDASSFFFTITV